jgi:outer membrane protein assembly factor BamB
VGIAKYDGGGDSGTSDNQGGDGPRSTPAVADGKVFVFNAQLGLHCLDAASGKEIWRRDLLKEHGGRNIQWQNAASPVLEGNLVLVAGGGPGQSFLGVHQQGGRVVWKSGDEKITHATPVVATLSGVRQVIFFTQSGLVSVATQDGRELWRHRFKFNVSTAASPVVADPVVYCSAGYGVGGTAVRITRQGDEFSATELWRTPGDKDVANHWSTPVHYRGHLYGMFSFKKFGDGPLKCVEIATGRVRWEKAGFGAGNVILAGDRLLALTDFGELVMVAARPDAYQEVGRTRAVGGKCWSTPALAASRLYVRSTTEGACLDLSTQTPSSGQ